MTISDRFPWQNFLLFCVLTSLATASCAIRARAAPSDTPPPPLASHHRHFADRADRLLRQLTLEEKIGQMSTAAPAVVRGGRTLIPAFDFWQEALHGMKVDAADEPGGTIFPQPIALAASFDRRLVRDVAAAIGSELRGASNAAEARGQGPRATNAFAPNINLLRDARWGRGSETYGEDPELTGRLAVEYVRGLQGGHPRYLQAAATCKHFAAYSFEEHEGLARFEFDARLDPRDARDSYLPAFHACVAEAQAAAVMCSYNALNGTPACASDWLLRGQLRGRMGFGGFVVSDCGAINSITEHHRWSRSHAEGFAAALLAGTDLACTDFSHIRDSLRAGLVSEADIDAAVRRLLLARFALGHFDDGRDDNPYRRVPPSVVGSRPHLELARRAAAAGTVLLKNEAPFPAAADAAHGLPAAPLLPLALSGLRRLTVLGPLANRSEYMLGTYYGYPSGPVVTPYQAVAERLAAHNLGLAGGGGVQLRLLTGAEVLGTGADTEAAVAACRASDLCLFFLGTSAVWGAAREATRFGTLPLLSPVVEAEGWDRADLLLPGRQLSLVQAVARRTATPIAVVLLHGGPLDVEWLQRSPRVAAMLTAWTPGQGGAAVADVLFGNASPAGRLPVSWPFNNYTAQSAFGDMSMRRWPGRTHRYLQVPVLYPFGHGLSFSSFTSSGMAARGAGQAAARSAGASTALLRVVLTVSNTGGRQSDEVVLLFLSFKGCAPQQCRQQRRWQRWLPRWLGSAGGGAACAAQAAVMLAIPCSGEEPAEGLPQQTLAGFERVHSLAPGSSAAVEFDLLPRHFAPFSPLESGVGGASNAGGSAGGHAAPYCGEYQLRAGTEQLAVSLGGPLWDPA